MKHIRTGRNIKSFRSCPHATGVSMSHLDVERIARGEQRLMAREARHFWLEEQWCEHFERAAGPVRVLPPSARFQRMKAG